MFPKTQLRIPTVLLLKDGIMGAASYGDRVYSKIEPENLPYIKDNLVNYTPKKKKKLCREQVPVPTSVTEWNKEVTDYK